MLSFSLCVSLPNVRCCCWFSRAFCVIHKQCVYIQFRFVTRLIVRENVAPNDVEHATRELLHTVQLTVPFGLLVSSLCWFLCVLPCLLWIVNCRMETSVRFIFTTLPLLHAAQFYSPSFCLLARISQFRITRLTIAALGSVRKWT